MRTTLKRGFGRTVDPENGTAGSLPEKLVSLYRQPPAASRSIRNWAGRVMLSLVLALVALGLGFRRWALPLVPRVAEDRHREHARPRPGREAARPDAARPADDGAPPRRQPAGRRRGGRRRALGHDPARARRPQDEHDLAALAAARPAGTRLLPEEPGLHGDDPDRLRLRILRRRRLARHHQAADRAAHQLPDHGRFQRLQAHRQRAGRGLALRRPQLLQQERRHRRHRLLEHRPRPGLPAPERRQRARVRPLPPHRLRLLPPSSPAGVPARAQGSDHPELRPLQAASARLGDHRQRQGRGLQRLPQRHDGAALRALRRPAAAGAPVADLHQRHGGHQRRCRRGRRAAGLVLDDRAGRLPVHPPRHRRQQRRRPGGPGHQDEAEAPRDSRHRHRRRRRSPSSTATASRAPPPPPATCSPGGAT